MLPARLPCCALFVTLVHAQTTGSFAGTMQGLSVPANYEATLPGDAVLHKYAGYFSTRPGQPQALAFGMPDYRSDLILQYVPNLDIDAMSTGNDLMPVDQYGVIRLFPNSWAAITFSVTADTLGDPGFPPAVVHQQAQESEKAGGDLFSWIVDGSVGPAPSEIGTTQLAQNSFEINIAREGAPHELDAHDLYVPALHQHPELVQHIAPSLGVFYFSLSAATAAAAPPSWFRRGPQTFPPSGATILVSTWDWANAKWNPPEVFRSFTELGLQQADDVDALAIGTSLTGEPVEPRITISLTRASPSWIANPTWDPILVVTANGLVALSLPTGSPNDRVGPRLRLGPNPGDVDGICFFDPKTPTWQVNVTGVRVEAPGTNPTVNLSAFRRRAPSLDAQQILCCMSFSEIDDVPDPGEGLVFYFVTFAGSPPLGVGSRPRTDEAWTLHAVDFPAVPGIHGLPVRIDAPFITEGGMIKLPHSVAITL
jgi:hypothetical protein